MRQRIIDAQEKVGETVGQVRGILDDLLRRRDAIGAELATLDAERERILIALEPGA